uniref:ALG2 alpha-1,3/1,6-mannosyltransferase n=1 Tax=Marmota marmota marmota TaxID=9994 RepID=A0A8C5YXK7_MARMA
MAQRQDPGGSPGPGPSVLFLHPDLGVGGAERLVLDAALALQARGCRVKIWTAHYDPGHCFAESRELPVRCAGDWLPRSLGWGGRGAAVCAYVRMIFLALYVLFLADEEFDVVVCDQATLIHQQCLGVKTRSWEVEAGALCVQDQAGTRFRLKIQNTLKIKHPTKHIISPIKL